MEFHSEGFDLDAVASSSSAGKDAISKDGNKRQESSIVYEVGGGVTLEPTAAATTDDDQTPTKDLEGKEEGEDEKIKTGKNSDDVSKEEDVFKEAEKEEKAVDPLEKAESLKQDGNIHFKEGRYLDALDCYTDAIETTPGHPTGKEVIKMRDEWQMNQTERLRKELYEQQQKRQQQRKQNNSTTNSSTIDAASTDTTTTASHEEEDDEIRRRYQQETFRLAHDKNHPHAGPLSIFHCNRAAALMQVERYEEAVIDCDIAVLLQPTYVKAYIRLASAYEKLDKTEQALATAQQALQFQPGNIKLQQTVQRLRKLEDERMEKLKAETMEKLKDLGNSILGNFGLSLDNFKAVQDPKTGSYSISFEQKK